MLSLAVPSIFRQPERWQVISTNLSVPQAYDARHRQWMAEHSHRHAHQEILFVLDGVGFHGLNEQMYPFAPGTIIFFDAFEEHDNETPEWAKDHDHLWLMLVQDHVIVHRRKVLDGEGVWVEGWNHILSPEETGLAGQACLTGVEAGSGWPVEFQRLRLLGAVTGIIHAVTQAQRPDGKRLSRVSFQERIIDTARKHIKATAGNGITLDQLARITGYSKYHFLRLFKSSTGLSVHEYIDQCRLERVNELKALGYTATQTAAELGFSCQSAFSRWYGSQRQKHK